MWLVECDAMARIYDMNHYKTLSIQRTPLLCQPGRIDEPPSEKFPPSQSPPHKTPKCGVIPNMDVQRHGSLAVLMYDCNGRP